MAFHSYRAVYIWIAVDQLENWDQSWCNFNDGAARPAPALALSVTRSKANGGLSLLMLPYCISCQVRFLMILVIVQ